MYIKFNDAGHGWLRVKINELKKLNISDKISSCSYIKGNYAYLEEDCDLSTFLDAKFKTDEEKIKFMQTLKISNANNDSTIRNYSSYKNYTDDEIVKYNKIKNYMLSKFAGKRNERKIKKATLEDLDYWNEFYNLGY